MRRWRSRLVVALLLASCNSSPPAIRYATPAEPAFELPDSYEYDVNVLIDMEKLAQRGELEQALRLLTDQECGNGT